MSALERKKALFEALRHCRAIPTELFDRLLNRIEND